MELQLHKQKGFFLVEKSCREILQRNLPLFSTLLVWQNYQVLLGVQTYTAFSTSFKAELLYAT